MIELLRGDAALTAIANEHFRAEWDALHAACPWATVFQRCDFARIWIRHYASRFELLLLRSRDAGGGLVGLLPLAMPHDGGTVVGLGDIHSEYQTFVARPEQGDAFMRACLERLAVELPDAVLRLGYVPAGTPLEWARSGDWAPHASLRAAPRPVADTADPGIQEDLKKRATRWRINRFAQYGPFRFLQVRKPAEFDALAVTATTLCDFRQAAANGIMPFRDDPAKLPFHRDLAVETQLLHVTAMWAGERLLSVQLNMHNGPELLLCVLGHHPAAARHSPGHIHMLMLAAMLAEQGVPRFDLSPEGSYKDRLGSVADVTHVVLVHLSRNRARRFRLTRTVSARGRDVLARAGLEPERVQARVSEVQNAARDLGVRALPTLGLRALRGIISARMERAVFGRDQAAASTPMTWGVRGDREHVRVDALEDLLAYRRASADARSRQEFLAHAMRRLSLGEHAYTVVDGGYLVACAWLDPVRQRIMADEFGLEANFPTATPLVHDLWAAGDDAVLLADVLDAALADAAGVDASSTDSAPLVLADAAHAPLLALLRARGFARRFSCIRRVHWGRTRTETDMPSEYVPPPPAAAGPRSDEPSPASPSTQGR